MAKTKALQLRLDPSTEATIKSKARETGMSVSEYVRSCCLRSTIRSSDAALSYELNRIGNALNELARQVNGTKGIDLSVLQSLLAIEHMVMAL